MMGWQIDIPYKDRGDLVLDTIKAAKEKFGEGDQRTRVVEVLANDALFNHGVTTVGQLIDGLGALDRAGVRARLDWARGELGLPSTGEVEQRREDSRFEAEFRRLQPPPPPRWGPMQSCPHCTAYPVDETGKWIATDLQRWHCPQHRHLAAEADLAKYEPPYVGFTSSGAPRPSAKEQARIAKWMKQDEDDRERERRQREAHDQAVAETIEAAKQHYADHGQISVLGIRTRPDLRIIEP
jgi:hypothetical protein